MLSFEDWYADCAAIAINDLRTDDAWVWSFDTHVATRLSEFIDCYKLKLTPQECIDKIMFKPN